MGNANIPRVFNQQMERLAMLDKATEIGYTQAFNDIWTAQFTLPADDPKNIYCQPFNYVEIFDEKRRIELFRIIKSTFTRDKQGKGFIFYECEHVITTLIDNVLFKFHQIGNIGVFTPEVINYVLSFQTVQNWRLGRCDFRRQFLYKWESNNLLAALFSIPKPFIDEWHFTYDTTTYPWTLNLMGAESEVGCEIRRRKNMQGITKEMDATNLVTRITPLGYGEGDNQLTIREVNNGLEYLDADTISIWGIKETIWTDRRFEDAENMMATARQMLERLKMPFITYSVDSIDLFKRTKQGFDEFKEGKLVRVIDRQDGIDIDTRIMEITKADVTKADVTVVIANKDRNVAGSIAALAERARINDTYAQGSETPQTIPFTDNAEPNFPAIVEFFVDAGMVNINKAALRVRLEPYRAFSRAIRGGGGRTQTTTHNGGTTQTTTQQETRTHTTTQQAQQTPTTSTHNTQTPTTSTTNTQTPTTSTTNQQAPTTSTTNQQTPSTSSGGSSNPTSGASSMATSSSASIVLNTIRMTGAIANSHVTTSGDPPHTHMLQALPVVPEHSHGMAHTHQVSIAAHQHSITIPGHQHSVTIPGHSHTVNIPGHSHSVTISGHSHSVTIPAHGHSVTIPAHAHNVTVPPHYHTVTMPDHTHDIEFGIVQGGRADSIRIRVDGNEVSGITDLSHINIIPFLRRSGGGRIARNTWHRIEIIPNRQTRIAGAIYLSVFTNSRGGENL